MIIPCIDLMGGKVVQLVQGRDKALERDSPDEMLQQFQGFPEIQVIDLDAAIGTGANDAMIQRIAAQCKARIGGGIRTRERFQKLLQQGAHRVIVGTAAFKSDGVDQEFLRTLDAARTIIALDSKQGKIVVRGWRESLDLTAEQVIGSLEPFCAGFLCTYVDKEGMMQGTDLAWFERLRAATSHEITAAGGVTTLDDVKALLAMGIHAALSMAIYTGRLDLADLRKLL